MFKIFQKNKFILEKYRIFKYIHVDEYQDINPVQQSWIKCLCQGIKIFVVRDDDQSIYSWRGADVSNLLNFEKFSKTNVLRLEQIIDQQKIF